MTIDQKKIKAMTVAGQKIRSIKKKLIDFSRVGIKFEDIETMATNLILESGGKPNFSLVEGYHWSTCINKNEGLCHGIPKNQVIEDGDLISIDLGMLYKNYNVDTSLSFTVGNASEKKVKMVEDGYKAFKKTVEKAVVGNSVYDLSLTMEKYLTKKGYSMTYQLTGHGVGDELHEEPFIPCVSLKSDRRHKLHEGQTIAIELMYMLGNPTVVIARDGWTYETKDKQLSCLVEETVLITADGPKILT
jgi:methionyl aminopeptidase